MITAEILRANPALAALTDDQINAVITIGTNDTNAEVARQFSETYRRMDSTIESITGIKRSGDEKTYAYMERALKEQKEGLTPLQNQVTTLQNEKAALEEQIAKGGDAALKSQLDGVKAELANAKADYAKLQGSIAKTEREHKSQIFNLTVGAEIQGAASGLKFKPEIPTSVADILVKTAIDKVKAMNPEYIDNGQGGKRLVFKGSDGAVLNNPQNALNPYTAGELLRNELKDVLAVERKAEGVGGPGSGAGAGNMVVDISSAKTQVEADEAITKNLLSQGLAIGSAAFQEAKDKAWADNNVSKLPLR